MYISQRHVILYALKRISNYLIHILISEIKLMFPESPIFWWILLCGLLHNSKGFFLIPLIFGNINFLLLSRPIADLCIGSESTYSSNPIWSFSFLPRWHELKDPFHWDSLWFSPVRFPTSKSLSSHLPRWFWEKQ